jgi:hypothetical protein
MNKSVVPLRGGMLRKLGEDEKELTHALAEVRVLFDAPVATYNLLSS